MPGPGVDLGEWAVGSHGRLSTFCLVPPALSKRRMHSFGGRGEGGRRAVFDLPKEPNLSKPHFCSRAENKVHRALPRCAAVCRHALRRFSSVCGTLTGPGPCASGRFLKLMEEGVCIRKHWVPFFLPSKEELMVEWHLL